MFSITIRINIIRVKWRCLYSSIDVNIQIYNLNCSVVKWWAHFIRFLWYICVLYKHRSFLIVIIDSELKVPTNHCCYYNILIINGNFINFASFEAEVPDWSCTELILFSYVSKFFIIWLLQYSFYFPSRAMCVITPI